MGRRRKKIYKKPKRKIPTKYFECPDCGYKYLIGHKEKGKVTFKCSCGFWGEVTKLHQGWELIDYYCLLIDKIFEDKKK